MPDTPQYIFGYGSLIESQSRMRSWPPAADASPCVVKGIERGWFDRVETPGLGPTYLGAVHEDGCTCNGVIFAISKEGLAAMDSRESGYIRLPIKQADINMLDGSDGAPEGDIWYYASTHRLPASPEFPIVQSYVDICVNGCLEQEAAYPLAKEAKFAESFLKTTTGWSAWWVNDRLYPRRPFIYVPKASTIDGLLKRVLGDELFSKIEIEPASWEGKGRR